MRKGFSEYSDTDRIILSNLDDRDLLNACLSSKYTNSLCDETFFMNRCMNAFPNLVKPNAVSWRNFYLENIYYVDLLEKKFNIKYQLLWKETPKQVYNMFYIYLIKKDFKIDYTPQPKQYGKKELTPKEFYDRLSLKKLKGKNNLKI